MDFPAKLTQKFSRLLLGDVLCRMLTHTASLTVGVDTACNVDAVLASRPEFQFRSNNDFGMLVERLATRAINADLTNLNDVYTSVADGDEYVETTLQDIGYSLAGIVINAHSVLRDVIPSEVTELENRIGVMLKDRLQQDPIKLPAVVMQDWGSLKDESYRVRVENACREHANVFHEGREIRPYYAQAVLSAAERFALETAPDAAGDALLRALLPDGTPDSDCLFYNSVFFRSYGARQLTTMASMALENGKKLHRAICHLAQVETLIHALGTKISDAETDPALVEFLSNQLPRLEQICYLISGAFYTLAVTTFRDCVILAIGDDEVVVNAWRMESFEQAGGTVDALQAFALYLARHSLNTPHSGWSQHRILDLAEKASLELIEARTEMERNLQSDNSVLLRSVVNRAVQDWCAECQLPNWLQTPEPICARALNALLTNVNKPEKSLCDLLTDYLIEIRNNTFLRNLKGAIYQSFARLQGEQDGDPAAKKSCAIVEAMAGTVADLMIKSYGEVC